MIIHHCYVLWILLIRSVYVFSRIYSILHKVCLNFQGVEHSRDRRLTEIIIEYLPREISSPSTGTLQDTRSFQSAYPQNKRLSTKLWAAIVKAGLERTLNLRKSFRANRMLKAFFHIFYNKIPCSIASVQQPNRWMSHILRHRNCGLQVLHTLMAI